MPLSYPWNALHAVWKNEVAHLPPSIYREEYKMCAVQQDGILFWAWPKNEGDCNDWHEISELDLGDYMESSLRLDLILLARAVRGLPPPERDAAIDAWVHRRTELLTKELIADVAVQRVVGAQQMDTKRQFLARLRAKVVSLGVVGSMEKEVGKLRGAHPHRSFLDVLGGDFQAARHLPLDE